MSRRSGVKSKSGKSKGKTDPQVETLERWQREVRNLREELDHANFIAETAEARRQRDLLDRSKSAKTLEDVKKDTLSHTSFLVTEYETAMVNLHEKIHKLEDQITLCNQSLDEKNQELEEMKVDFAKRMMEKEEYISHLEKELKTQSMLSRDALTRALDQLGNKMRQDFDKCFEAFEPLSKQSQKVLELEFMRPPYHDEESTEYY